MNNVGKSTLLHRCFFNEHPLEAAYIPTVDELYQGQMVYNGHKYNMTVHEMGGQRQFPVMRQLLIKKSDGFILVYAVDSPASFEEVRRLYDIIVDVKGADVPVVLVGNKSDVINGPLSVNCERVASSHVCATIRRWGHKVQRIETSARNNDNCRLMFDKLMRMMDERRGEQLHLNCMKEMRRFPLHKLLSILHIPPQIFSFEGINQVVTRKKRARRRRRRISSSSSGDCTMQLLYVSVSPLIPDVRDFVNLNW